MKNKFLLLISIVLSPICSLMAAPFPAVKLVTSDWPPYVGSQLDNKGYIYVIVMEAFKKANYNATIEFRPWSEAIKLARYHNDAIFPSYYRSEHENLSCSDPIDGGPVGFYKRKETPIQFSVADPAKEQLAALQALKQYRFGVVSGYINTPVFDKADFLQKRIVSDDFSNLKQLADGKVDLIFTDIFVAEYLIEKHKPAFNNLEFMGPSLDYKKMHVCFSTKAADYEKKKLAFNTGLKQLKESGKLNAIVNNR